MSGSPTASSAIPRCSPASTAASSAPPSSPASWTRCWPGSRSTSSATSRRAARSSPRSSIRAPSPSCRSAPWWCSRSSCSRSSRSSSPNSTPSCRCRPGCCWASPTSSAPGGGRSLAGFGAVLLLGFVVTRFHRGKYARDAFLLKIPVLGETIRYSLVERFCRVLSSMVGAGVNLTEALAVTTEALRNRVFIKRLGEVSDAMLEGEGISGPLARTQLFPGTATQMLRDRRGDRVARRPAPGDGGVLRGRARLQDQEADRDLRAAGHHRDGRDRRVRRHRARLRDVRHLPTRWTSDAPTRPPALGQPLRRRGDRWSRRWWRS